MDIKKAAALAVLPCCFLLMFACSLSVTAADASGDLSAFYADEGSAEDPNDILTFVPGDGASLFANENDLVIVLDPGHGGKDPGARTVASSTTNRYERELNLAVAKYCKAYLEQFPNVSVYLTRSDNGTYHSLQDRAAIAASHHADVMISLHFNSTSNKSARGAEVYVSRLKEYALTELGERILNEIGAVGVAKIGVKTRASGTNTMWRDKLRVADYYGIIKHPAYREIPSMIVEHCFISNANDYYAFADSDAKLKRLGEADGKAIAAYFRLNESISAEQLENRRSDALNRLDAKYAALNLDAYSASDKALLENIYTTARSRIANATAIGKIDINVDRAVKTIAAYSDFIDVQPGQWFYPAVIYCKEKKIFYGISNVRFGPKTAITRGMFMAVIGRLDGVDAKAPAATAFQDVKADAYYAPYVKWAAENGIIEGTSATTFSPNANIRREDLLRILKNYAEYRHAPLIDVSAATIDDFVDGDTVDSWGVDGMNWGIQKGIIKGDDKNRLNPRSGAVRAEVAQMMMNYHPLLKPQD